MTTNSQPQLSEGQKACLRLVDDHHTSKEIARILGISPFTVDQRLDAARRKLNAASRKDAAKIFAAIEEGTISEPFVYEPITFIIGSSAVCITERMAEVRRRNASSICCSSVPSSTITLLPYPSSVDILTSFTFFTNRRCCSASRSAGISPAGDAWKCI